MNDDRDRRSSVEHLDVIVVGAGLSGIGAACHLKMECPQKSFVILEGRDTMGGTWDLFRYPGVRSDSDMYTLGYPFRPWRDPRAIADADLFTSIREGRVSIVTDHIETFTEDGLLLKSGEHLDADIIVTATGLVMKLFSGMELVVDGAPVDMPQTLVYKGMMFSDVPNLAFAVGYTNASWTLKCDLTAEYVCRLLNHMDQHGYAVCTPRVNDPDIEEEPVIDFNSGYVLRALPMLPRQGSKKPWRLHQNYVKDLSMMRYGRVEDGAMEFNPAHGAKAVASG